LLPRPVGHSECPFLQSAGNYNGDDDDDDDDDDNLSEEQHLET
jgi:hypothetical protein